MVCSDVKITLHDFCSSIALSFFLKNVVICEFVLLSTGIRNKILSYDWSNTLIEIMGQTEVFFIQQPMIKFHTRV